MFVLQSDRDYLTPGNPNLEAMRMPKMHSFAILYILSFKGQYVTNYLFFSVIYINKILF